jgi:hypothetical protein
MPWDPPNLLWHLRRPTMRFRRLDELPPSLKRQEEAERLELMKTGRSHGDAHDTHGAAGGRGRPGCG